MSFPDLQQFLCFQNVPSQQCTTSYERECDTVYAEVCTPVTRQVCEKVHYQEVCRDVTTQECSQQRPGLRWAEQGGGAGLDCFQQLQGLALCAADAAAPEAQAACCELAGALDAVSPPVAPPSSRPRHSEPAAHRTATPAAVAPVADPLR